MEEKLSDSPYPAIPPYQFQSAISYVRSHFYFSITLVSLRGKILILNGISQKGFTTTRLRFEERGGGGGG